MPRQLVHLYKAAQQHTEKDGGVAAYQPTTPG
jgi:hypothetical protein